MYCCCVSIIIVICICPPGSMIWLINLFLYDSVKNITHFGRSPPRFWGPVFQPTTPLSIPGTKKRQSFVKPQTFLSLKSTRHCKSNENESGKNWGFLILWNILFNYSKPKNSHAINYNILKFSEIFVTLKYLLNTSGNDKTLTINFLDYQFGLLPFLKDLILYILKLYFIRCLVLSNMWL